MQAKSHPTAEERRVHTSSHVRWTRVGVEPCYLCGAGNQHTGERVHLFPLPGLPSFTGRATAGSSPWTPRRPAARRRTRRRWSSAGTDRCSCATWRGGRRTASWPTTPAKVTSTWGRWWGAVSLTRRSTARNLKVRWLMTSPEWVTQLWQQFTHTLHPTCKDIGLTKTFGDDKWFDTRGFKHSRGYSAPVMFRWIGDTLTGTRDPHMQTVQISVAHASWSTSAALWLWLLFAEWFSEVAVSQKWVWVFKPSSFKQGPKLRRPKVRMSGQGPPRAKFQASRVKSLFG